MERCRAKRCDGDYALTVTIITAVERLGHPMPAYFVVFCGVETLAKPVVENKVAFAAQLSASSVIFSTAMRMRQDYRGL